MIHNRKFYSFIDDSLEDDSDDDDNSDDVGVIDGSDNIISLAMMKILKS